MTLYEQQDGVVKTPELAQLVGVTTQTILNYIAAGLKPVGKTPKGGNLFDREAALRWIKENRPETRHGGKRPRSGPKPRWRPPVVPGQDAADSPLAQAARAVPLDPELETLSHKLIQGQATPEEVAKLYARLSRADIEKIQQIVQAMRTAHDLAVKKGEVVNAAQVLEQWKIELEGMRRRLEGMTSRLSQRVMAAGQLEGQKEPLVRAAIGEEIRSFIEELRVA